MKWYVPKAGSTVSVSHGDQTALPREKTATLGHMLRSRAHNAILSIRLLGYRSICDRKLWFVYIKINNASFL